MAIQLSLSKKNFLDSFLSSYLFQTTRKTTLDKLPKPWNRKFANRGQIFGQSPIYLWRNSPQIPYHKLINHYKSLHRKISPRARRLQNKQLRKFKLNMQKNYKPFFLRYNAFTAWNLRKKLIFPTLVAKTHKVRSFNTLPFKRKQYVNKIFNSFYNVKNIENKNLTHFETKLEILLVRAQWALSINQARFWIKSGFILNSKPFLTPGNIIKASPKIIPDIIKNQITHFNRGTSIPPYININNYTLALLRKPELSEINVPSTMTNKHLVY